MLLACLASALLFTGCATVTAQAPQRPNTPARATATPTQSPKLTFSGPWTLTHPDQYTSIDFTPTTSYADALEQVTDLGLQPVNFCAGAQLAATWAPLSQAKTFATGNGGQMGVFATPAAPSDWLARLSALPQIASLENGDVFCQLIPVGDPNAPTGVFLGPAAKVMTIQVTFIAGDAYDQALAAMTNLGFRLTNPCAEHAPAGTAWQPAGQASAFAASHALTLATTFANSTIWQRQLTQMQGVHAVQINYSPAC
jgi:hypothetical protein